MNKLTIKDLQAYLKDRYKSKDHTNALFMKLVEEIGEVAEAINKNDGRKRDDGQSNLAEELCDVIHYTLAIAAVNDIDMESVIISKDTKASVKYHHDIDLTHYLKQTLESETK